MFVKVVFVTLLVATIDEAAVLVSAEPQLTNGIGSLMPGGGAGGAAPTNIFQNIDFGNVPTLPPFDKPAPANATTCTCAVFMSGQFKRGSTEQPTGFAALISELEQAYPCNPVGMKTCVNRCLESLIKHLPNSEAIICGTINRDCHKERAHLFVKNCEPHWVNSNLSAGREYCCKENKSYTCPLM